MAMTEAEWLACENPNYALSALSAVGVRTRRKDRLAAAAGLRHFWADLTAEQRRAVTAAEQYADGDIRFTELRAAAVRTGRGVSGTLPEAVARVTHRVAADALWVVTLQFLPVVFREPIYTNPPFPQARAYAVRGRPVLAIFRDVYGNPFRPVSVDPRWLTSPVVDLARTMYDARDFAAMPILADALEEAGCDNADILAHCRGLGPHVRGCWVVDLILGTG
jgi:hypothetical protein